MSMWLETKDRVADLLHWSQVDVFAEAAYQGNMLAIFHDARSLTDAQMQAMARETNLSETTFLLPSDDPEEDAREGMCVRIFTVEEELPFAGHPTLGTAAWLWANHAALQGADEVKLRLKAGTIPVRFTAPAEGEAGVYGEMRQRDPQFDGTALDVAAIAAACGLPMDGLHAELRPQVVSTGLPFCVAPVASLEALAQVRVDQPALLRALGGTAAKFVYAIAPAGEGTWRARMPFYGQDDPATGSAAGCAISYLVRHGAVASGSDVTILQGQEVGRPSRISVRASLIGDRITDVFVGGRTIPVANGWFTHP
jgi:trans-2,3-dihydro-3-hydroxyanthranilate isomerase